MDKTNKNLIDEEPTPEMEDLILDDIKEKVNEVSDGKIDTWIYNNHDSLVNEFVGERNDEFSEYCKMRYKETNE